jgi:hypothetical protein
VKYNLNCVFTQKIVGITLLLDVWLIEQQNVAGGAAYILGLVANGVFFSQWGYVLFCPANIVGSWYHLAVTNVSSITMLYLNGILCNTAAAQPNYYIATQQGPIYLGGVCQLWDNLYSKWTN